MKLLGAFLLFLLCCGFGVYGAFCAGRRMKELEKLQYAFLEIAREIRGRQLPFARILEGVEGTLFDAIRQWGSYRTAKSHLQGRSVLSVRDWQVLDRFFAGFGHHDAEREAAACTLTAEQLSLLYRESVEKYKKVSRLYPSVGVLAGLFLLILSL